MNNEALLHHKPNNSANPTEADLVKKQEDFFDTFWLQWMHVFGREPPKLPIQECKTEDNPAYTYHASECIQSFIKQQAVKQQTDIQRTESFEGYIQRRAIAISQKKDLSPEERNELLRYRQYRLGGYLFKKNYRSFEKKIVYDTRKKVADRRIRFKGRFINQFQAMELLGLTGQHSFEQLKQRMKALSRNGRNE